MSGFFEYIRQVIFVALMVQVALMLVPDGEIRGYVRLVCGLLVLAAIASPLVRIIPELEDQWRGWDDNPLAVAPGGEEAVRTGAQQREALTETVYGKRLSALIGEEVQGLPGVFEAGLQVEVAVEADASTGKLHEVRVGLGRTDGGDEEDDRTHSAVSIAPIRIGDRDEREPADTEEEVPESLRAEIAGHLRRSYGLDENEIHIFWMEGYD